MIFLLNDFFLHTQGDSLRYHNRVQFSTKDRDNDENAGDCANHFRGAWWFKACYNSHLNGFYRNTTKVDRSGIEWNRWKGIDLIRRTVMKISPN